MTGNDDLLAESGVDLVGRGQLEPRVCVGALGSGGAEAGEVIEAEHPAHVPVPARRAVATEAAVVPRTVADLRLGIDVQKWTLLVMASV